MKKILLCLVSVLTLTVVVTAQPINAFEDEITAFAAPITATHTVGDATCYGAPNGSITVNISGGTPPYILTCSSGDTISSLNGVNVQLYGLIGGIYYIVIHDTSGNIFNDTAIVEQPSSIVADIYLSRDSVCPGDSVLAIGLISGGTPPINIVWTYNSFDFMYNDTIYLIADTVRMIVADNNGCTFVVDTIIYPCDNPSGVKEIRSSNVKMELYPNPATTTVTISIDARLTDEVGQETMIASTAIITDITGRKMAAVKLATSNQQLATDNFPNGLYFVTVANGGQSATHKLVVSR